MSIPTAPPRSPASCNPRQNGEALRRTTQSKCPTCGRNESGTKTNDPSFLNIIFTSFIPAVLSFAVPYAYILGYYVALYAIRREVSYYRTRTIEQKNAPAGEVLNVVPRVGQHFTADPHLNCVNRFGSYQVVNHDSRTNLKRRKKTGTIEDVRSILRPYQNSSILIRDQNFANLKHRDHESPGQAAKINEMMDLIMSWGDTTAQMVSAGYLIRIPGAYNEQFKFQEGDMIRVRDSVFLEHQRDGKRRTEWEESDIVKRLDLVEMWDRLTIEMCDHFYLAIFPNADS